MATSGTPVHGEGAAVGAAQQQMVQGLAQLQDAARQEWQGALRQMQRRVEEDRRRQEQEADRRLQQVKREMEAKVQQLEQKVGVLERQLRERGPGDAGEGAAALLGEKVGDVQRQQRERGPNDAEEGAAPLLEGRLARLEASVQRALEKVFPRVDALVAQLERAPYTPTPSSTASAAPPPASTHGPYVPAAWALGKQRLALTRALGEQLGRAAREGCALGEQLLEAAREGRLEDVQRLLDAGADPSYAAEDGWTPLMKAAYRGFATVASLLLQSGADVHAKERWGATALHYAASHDYSDRCVAPLVAAGARVDCRDDSGQTPLYWAAHSDNEAAVRALLAAGASKTLTDNGGRIPLDRARSDAVRRLLRP